MPTEEMHSEGNSGSHSRCKSSSTTLGEEEQTEALVAVPTNYNYFPIKKSFRSFFSLGGITRSFYRISLPILEAQGKLLYERTTSTVVFRIAPRLLLKINLCRRFAEANTLRFIKENTSIPVPAVIDAWSDQDGRSITLIEWIPNCETLRDCWADLSEEQKRNIASQLRSYIDQLRKVPRPSDQRHLGPIDDSPFLHDSVLGRPCKPFASEKDFNKLLISRVEPFGELADSAKQQIQWIWSNIHRKGNVAAIIDWTMSGWMPEYWEYTCSAMLPDGIEDWPEYVKTFAYPDEAQLQVQRMFVEMHGYGPWYR